MTDLDVISRQGGAGFRIELANAAPLDCQEVVRHLAGRRVVCRAYWQGQMVFAKLFIGEQAERYAARDAQGARALLDKGLRTPELLHEGALSGEPGRVLIFAYIPASRNAEDIWQKGDMAQRKQLADQLVQTVAAHHAAGLVQTDLYPRNFLQAADGIYTLDGDGIRIFANGVDRKTAMRNLVLLFSKFDVLDDAHIPEWLEKYAHVRGWPDGSLQPESVRAQVQIMRYQLAHKNVIRKVLRNCTAIHAEKHNNRFLVVVRKAFDSDLQQAVDAPDRLLDAPGGQRLKNGNTCTVGLVQSGARKIVIKRYNIKNFWHGLGRAWRRTRASVSWSNTHLLQAFEIPTPAPLALVERRWGPFRREAWFLTDFVDGPDITEVFADAATSEAQKQEAAAQVARLFYKLRLLKIEHGDMKATNMKWVGGQPLLLDLDAMKMHRCERLFLRRHARDLRRFLKNWHNAPDILRMMKSALMQVYGSDPVLLRAGIRNTSETT